ncbi:MAG: hypothetical protein MJE77_16160 [Proteobacteria bacterium]|nr:hypothetical protein [Pseudomonadota bacterium]
MWLHNVSSSLSWIACLSFAFLLPLSASGCALDAVVTAPTIGTVRGYIGTAEPIAGASIDIYSLDAETGESTSQYPLLTIPMVSDDHGEFEFSNAELAGTLLFLARGGLASEYWSDERVELPQSHLTAVVADWVPGSTRPITITPWTSLAHQLAIARTNRRENEAFSDAVRESEALLYEHFIVSDPGSYEGAQCAAYLNCLRPTTASSFAQDSLKSPESDNYALSLLALSALVAEIADKNLIPVARFNTVKMTIYDLTFDAADGRFDGLPDNSMPQVTPHTLRSELGRAFVTHYLDQSQYTYADFRYELDRMAGNDEPRLFRRAGPEPIDESAPSLHILPTMIYDERYDQILFTENRTPVHLHSTSHPIALETLFNGVCSEIHKHTNLLEQGTVESNPLQWRFVAYDDISGVANVEATVSFGPANSPQYPVRADVSEQRLVDSGYDIVVTALSTDVPELASREGDVQITVVASDHAGNKSQVLSGCWRHVPRAPPLWVGPMRTSGESQLLSEYSLEGDNLAPVLRDNLPLSEAPALGLFEVYNPNEQPAYLVMNTAAVSGQYSWVWHYHNELEAIDERTDSCIRLGTCTPVDPVRGEVASGFPNPPIPSSNASLTVDGELCDDCSGVLLSVDPNESLTVAVRWHDFGLLVREDINGMMIRDTLLDPVDGFNLATGVETTYIHCELDNGDGTCSRRVFYSQKATLRGAHFVAQGLVQGLASPASSLPVRRPVPATNSFAAFGRDHEFVQTWTTTED